MNEKTKIIKNFDGDDIASINLILKELNVNNFGRFMTGLFYLYKINANVSIFQNYYKKHRDMLMMYNIDAYIEKDTNSWFKIYFLSFLFSSCIFLYTITF